MYLALPEGAGASFLFYSEVNSDLLRTERFLTVILCLEGNNLTKIPQKTFDGNNRLQTIILARNQLEYLKVNIWLGIYPLLLNIYEGDQGFQKWGKFHKPWWWLLNKIYIPCIFKFHVRKFKYIFIKRGQKLFLIKWKLLLCSGIPISPST